jgi:translation elongation factor EF-Ts
MIKRGQSEQYRKDQSAALKGRKRAPEIGAKISASKIGGRHTEAAIAKIVEGRISGFYKDVALVEQPYAKDDKLSVAQFIGAAKILQYSQIEIG